MKRIFGRYGELVDIDIKRPPPGTGNAYAFIRDVADTEAGCVNLGKSSNHSHVGISGSGPIKIVVDFLEQILT